MDRGKMVGKSSVKDNEGQEENKKIRERRRKSRRERRLEKNGIVAR